LKSRHAANVALSCYVKGEWVPHYSDSNYWGPGGEYDGNEIKPKARNRNNYEVVEVELRY
jgi:hypothetical protein